MAVAAAEPEDELIFLPLGGAGEIGMNLNLYGYGPPGEQVWMIADLGVTFGDARTPGVDLIMPDPSFIVERRDDLLGLVLTHAHEDHIGAVAHLWPQLLCPIYATPFTAFLVRAKLAEAGLEEEADLHIIELGSRFELGPFDIELVTLTHSIPEPNALAIRTPLGNVLHSGDWKIDPDPVVGEEVDEEALRGFGDEGCLALVCDSTNVFSPGTSGSEGDVKESLMTLLSGLSGRIAITTFASNVARLQTIAEVAAAHDRHVVLVGRSLFRIVAAARDCGYLKNVPEFLTEYDAGYLPPEKMLLLCTGSQGEARAALARIADGSHPNVTLNAGDTVIFSSRIIPGNETAIFELQNQLARNGVRVITEKDHFVHVSGHPCREELEQMYQWVQPKIAVPVHGEARHLLEHAALARELQVPQAVVVENGAVLRLAPGPARIIDHAPAGRLYLDGNVLVNELDETIRERRRIAFEGLIAVSVVVDAKGALARPPRVVLEGVPEHDDRGDDLADLIVHQIEETLSHHRKGKAELSEDALAERLRIAVRRFARAHTGKKPITRILLTKL